jgi:CheY-like chemotaxis protein
LTNAIKFTENGGVHVWVGCEENSLVVRVSDSGIGISEAQLQQLFVPFRQADSSTTRRFGGTGLGLSISRRLAQLMGGDIVARSEPGRGSMFELHLPLQRADTGALASQAEGHWSATQRRLQGLRLLVAEDNPVNQIIIEAALSMEGAVVTVVNDGQQAVDRVRSDGGSGFDLVLMDLQMPVMDGYAATRHIRGFAPGLPVVGQTAHAMAEERDRCFAAGMVAHVAKPIDLELLVTTVEQHALRRRR